MDWLEGCRRNSEGKPPPPDDVAVGPSGGLAIEDAGDDVWQLNVRSRRGGGANMLELGTAKNEEVSGKARETRASLPLPPPRSSPSLPLSAKYSPASSKDGGGEKASFGLERPRLDIAFSFPTPQFFPISIGRTYTPRTGAMQSGRRSRTSIHRPCCHGRQLQPEP